MPRAMLSLLIAVAACVLPPARADIGAAVGRSAPHKGAVLPMVLPLSRPLTIPLEKVEARASAPDADRESFYLGTLAVGYPAQEMRVMFDTSSGHVQLPHRACKSLACLEHRQYSPWQSYTAMDVNVDGREVQKGNRLARGNVTRDGVTLSVTHADLGVGDAQGVLVRDSVCLGQGRAACVDLEVLAAIRLDDHPFLAMPNDGIVGLGMQGLASGPLCSLFGRMMEGSHGVKPQFGIFLGAEQGEVHFGGLDTRHLTAPVQWFPVDHPESGYWQVAIQAVRVGNRTVDDCRRGCHGVVDSGSSRLGVQATSLPRLREALASHRLPGGGCGGPELAFDLGGMTITLGAEDYADGACAPELGPLDLDESQFVGLYAFGEAVLRRYYAAFDWEARRVGFAPAAWRPEAVPLFA